MKKILFVANYKPHGGGICVQVDTLRTHLRVCGVETALCSTGGGVWKRLLLPFRLVAVGWRCPVWHIHTCSYRGFLSAVAGLAIGRLLRKRCVVTYHGGDCERFFADSPWAPRWLRLADCNTAPTACIAGVFARYGVLCSVVPNVADFQYHPRAGRMALKPSFICTRHLQWPYNIPVIIQAFSEVQRNYPQATLTLVGDGRDRQSLERMVMELGLRNVRFAGQVEHTRMVEILEKNDIFVSASLIDNMPLSFLEANACGCLVIASNVGGVPEMVHDRETGLIFEPHRANELTGAMLWALRHPAESLGMIDRAGEDMDRYHWENIKKWLFSAYGI